MHKVSLLLLHSVPMSHSHKVVLVWPRHSTHGSSALVVHWLLRTDQTCAKTPVQWVASCESHLAPPPKVHLVSSSSANQPSLYTCTLWNLSVLHTRWHGVTQCLIITHSSHPHGVIITLAETCDILPATASTAKGLSFAVGVHKYHASFCPAHVHY